MDSSTTIVNVNPEQLEKLVEFMSGVVGTSLAKPTSTAEFAALMCAQASALIDGADEADAEGCFQVLFKDIQVSSQTTFLKTILWPYNPWDECGGKWAQSGLIGADVFATCGWGRSLRRMAR